MKFVDMPEKIKALDSLRFIWVMTIVLSHLSFMSEGRGGGFYKFHFQNGRTGVYFFFLLSGFGLTYSLIIKGKVGESLTGGKKDPVSLLKYAIKRTSKIYKPYIVSILLCVPITLYSAISLHGIKAGIWRTVSKAIFVPFLVQSATGINWFSHAFNGVCWFLSTLFLLYTVYPLMNRINGRIWSRKKIICSFMLVILIIGTVWHITLTKIESITPFDALSYESPYFRILCFSFGMLLCDLRFQVKTLKHASMWEVIALLDALLWWMMRNVVVVSTISIIDTEVKETIDLLLPALCIFVFSYEAGILSEVFGHKAFIALGDCAMYVFLYHSVVVGTIVPITESINMDFEIRKWLCTMVVFVFTTIATIFFYRIPKRYNN